MMKLKFIKSFKMSCEIKAAKKYWIIIFLYDN